LGIRNGDTLMTNGIPPEQSANWPAGHRAAAAIVVSVEGPMTASGNTTVDTGVDYAATGLHRLLGLLEDLDITVTTCWSESALNTLPQLLRRVADQGHEIAASFGSDTVAAADSSLVGALKRVSGQAIKGALTTSSAMEQSNSDSTGFAWQISGGGGDLPSIAGGTGGAAPTVQIPLSPYWIDRTWLHPDHPLPPSSLLEAWSASLAAIRSDGSLMTLVVHPHIMLRPGFSGTLIRFLDEVIASGDVWLTRVDNLALWWAQRNTVL
jgi:hypothetical protein